MKLHIAGGCGEHGRSCFHVTGDDMDFLVDCGLMAGERERYPRLQPQEIYGIQTVFLTHSHADHTGALPWLYENGFCGEVVATEHALAQLPFKPRKAVALENICASGQAGAYRNLNLKWGKSGHCLGSVWYRFKTKGKAILFSGDYTESSPVYRADRIRGQQADLAVLDCAYGKSTGTYEEACEELVISVEQLLQKHNSVVLPVPKYGRGPDLLFALLRSGLKTRYYGDTHFRIQLRNMRFFPAWYYTDGNMLFETVHPYSKGSNGIVFVSDSQLRDASAFKTAMEVIEGGGSGIMTGTVEKGTNSAHLIETGKMLLRRYPVHLNYSQYENLARENQFTITVPYHSADMRCEKTTIEI